MPDTPSASNPLGLDGFSSCGEENLIPETSSLPNVPGGCCVESVNGKKGVVVLTTTDINEGLRKYFTNDRAIAAFNAVFPLHLASDGTFTHDVSGVGAGTYGSSTQYPVITVDDKGHVTGVGLQDLPIAIISEIITALEALVGTGYLAKTGVNTWALRTIQGSTGRTTVTNGDPQTANSVIDLAKIITPAAAITYGSSSQIPKITIDQYGRVTGITLVNVDTSGGGTTGPTTLGALDNVNDTADAPTYTNEILRWSGTEWVSGPAGFVKYKGTWNATTNVITSTDVSINGIAMPVATAVNEGWYFVVGTGGSTIINGEAVWVTKDWIVSTGSTWVRISSGTSVPLITISKAAADTLIGTNGLVPGQQYKITGVSVPLYGGTDIFLKAATTNRFEVRGHGIFYNPNYNSGGTPYGIYTGVVAPNVIWGGKHWTNVNGLAGAFIDDFTLNSEWAVVPYDSVNYNQVIDEIEYNFDTDNIDWRRDMRLNNEVDTQGYIAYFAWGHPQININKLQASQVNCLNYKGSNISACTFLGSGVINFSDVSLILCEFKFSAINFTASGDLSEQQITLTEFDGAVITIDVHASASLFGAFSKKIWCRPNLQPIVSWVNNAGCFVTGEIDTPAGSPFTFYYGNGAAPTTAGAITAGTAGTIAQGSVAVPVTYPNVTDDLCWYAEPVSEVAKVHWYNSVPNQGPIGSTELFETPTVITTWRLYVTSYPTTFTGPVEFRTS